MMGYDSGTAGRRLHRKLSAGLCWERIPSPMDTTRHIIKKPRGSGHSLLKILRIPLLIVISSSDLRCPRLPSNWENLQNTLFLEKSPMFLPTLPQLQGFLPYHFLSD